MICKVGTPMERLLLVEHNLLFRDGLALLLQWRTGLSSSLASTLAEARCVLGEENRKPTCAIVDLDLPEGEGTKLLERLDGIPVLALIGSRSPHPECRAEALGLGADEVLRTTEPVDEIIAAVERLVFAEAERRRLVELEDRVQLSHVG
jgi:DNA-binding NarL/FixJ family response regulator